VTTSAVERQLLEREAQYRRIFDAAGDGLEVWDLETGRLVEVNPAECRMLAERGLLDLDAPVRRYVPELADPDVAAQLTVRHLATQSSGFFGEGLPNGTRNDDGLERVVPQLAALPRFAAPGREFSYSNLGVCVEGRVVEILGTRPYCDLLAGWLLQPLGPPGPPRRCGLANPDCWSQRFWSDSHCSRPGVDGRRRLLSESQREQTPPNRERQAHAQSERNEELS
jgi:CubicO group peptidase (beta-lactamase class C family)